MFWNKTHQLQARITNLERRLDHFECTLKRLTDQMYKAYDELLTKCTDSVKPQDTEQVCDADVVIDFNNISAFSVERMTQDGGPVTCVGYWRNMPDKPRQTGEWYLQCNLATHQRLVTEFRDHIKLKHM